MDKHKNMQNLLIFLAWAFGLTWLCWIPAALWGREVMSSLWVVPFLLGGFGPSAAGVIMLYRTRSPEQIRHFWSRLFDFQRISPTWYGIILLLFPFLLGAAFGLHVFWGGSGPTLEQYHRLGKQPGLLIGLIVGGLLTGPISEELGWRGYFLDELRMRRSALVSGLVTVPLWWAWHLPLFWIRGTSQSTYWMEGGMFWVFLVQTLPLSIFLTWSSVKNQDSILAPVLVHFMFNTALSLVHPIPERVAVLIVVLFSAAVVVMIHTGKSGWFANR